MITSKLTRLALLFAITASPNLFADDTCPEAYHPSEVCGQLTVTDFMGVPGTTTKFWIKQDDDSMIRLRSYGGSWGYLAQAAFMHRDACLYSDQDEIEGEIDIAEVCLAN